MRIGHYMYGIWEPGGVASYIRRLSAAQIAAGDAVYFLDNQTNTSVPNSGTELPIFVRDDRDLFTQAKALRLDILHLHTDISTLPDERIATIRTIHGHKPYCPSGGKYLKRSSRPCDRIYSLTGCLWGHLVDRCGSARPHKLYADFQNTWDEMRVLSDIHAIANSQFLKDQMVRLGYAENLIHVLYYPAPKLPEYFLPPQEDVPHFLFMGRIVPQKGLNWLLRAIQKVSVPVHLDIAGDGYQKTEIQALSERLGLSKKVTFHGWTDEADIFKLLQAARALIFPSVWHEPAGIVSIEAAAAGRPIIASRVGGIPEYIAQQQHTLLVKPNDISELAQNIERLALDWSLAKHLGEEARKIVPTQFSMQKHLDVLKQLYELAMQVKTGV
ncbi:glycosyltransferase family 4 protein [Cyanobacteria bacterium FACHB-472]|nr:glycosyltransferase family 4 protein [Cyanobacteria bacterium FACHB-472]